MRERLDKLVYLLFDCILHCAINLLQPLLKLVELISFEVEPKLLLVPCCFANLLLRFKQIRVVILHTLVKLTQRLLTVLHALK